MLIAKIDEVFTTRHGTEYSRTIKNRYKSMYQDLLKLVVHDPSPKWVSEFQEAGSTKYRVNGLFQVNRKTSSSRTDSLTVAHANALSVGPPNALYLNIQESSTFVCRQFHLLTEDNRDTRFEDLIFQTAYLPIGIVNQDTGQVSENHLTRMVAVLPFGAVVREITTGKNTPSSTTLYEVTRDGLRKVGIG